MRISGQELLPQSVRSENPVRESSAVNRRTTSAPEGGSPEVSVSDKVELSANARDVQRAREAVEAAPEVREDRVAAARRALESGKLPLRGDEIAPKLLQDAVPPENPQG